MFIRWGRASYGGFNKKLEELARRMNSKHDSDDENEEEDEFGVAERDGIQIRSEYIDMAHIISGTLLELP